MKIHWLQHVPFEGLGCIEEWAREKSAELNCTRLFKNEALPTLSDFDWLIVMGGPMGIYDHAEFPWLIEEKALIRKAIDANKTVLGICLGAQMMADVLGAKVYPGPCKEIGWFPIKRRENAPEIVPETLTVFHWHGDTFEIPEGAIPLAVSEPGINQGFVYNGNAVALQFHMETTAESMKALISNCRHELISAPYIQSAEQMVAGSGHIETVNAAMNLLLNSLL